MELCAPGVSCGGTPIRVALPVSCPPSIAPLQVGGMILEALGDGVGHLFLESTCWQRECVLLYSSEHFVASGQDPLGEAQSCPAVGGEK